MSTFAKETKHPKTGEWETATWIDDLFGRHIYGVVFPSDEKAADISKHIGLDTWHEEVKKIAFNTDEESLETRDSINYPEGAV